MKDQKQIRYNSMQRSLVWLLLCVGSSVAFPLFQGEDWEPGLIDIGNDNGDMFYIFMKARHPQPKTPLLIWLNGGPGCSAILALFQENGPYRLNRHDRHMEYNPYSWNEVAHVLYIDQPVNTGYSRAKPQRECRTNGCVALNMYIFLVKFLEIHPELQGGPLYVAGECYAGKYIPAICAHIAKAHNPMINLKGMLVGAPYTDQMLQETVSSTYFYEHGLFGLFKTLQSKLAALLYWTLYVMDLIDMALQMFFNFQDLYYPDIVNIYDLRDNKNYDDWDFNTEWIMNNPETKQLLGIPDNRTYNVCTKSVFDSLYNVSVTAETPNFEYLLDQNYSLVVLSGLYDGSMNWHMIEKELNSFSWTGAQDYQAAPTNNWTMNGTVYGSRKQARNLALVKVFDSGHYIPYNQPQFTLHVLSTLLNATA